MVVDAAESAGAGLDSRLPSRQLGQALGRVPATFTPTHRRHRHRNDSERSARARVEPPELPPDETGEARCDQRLGTRVRIVLEGANQAPPSRLVNERRGESKRPRRRQHEPTATPCAGRPKPSLLSEGPAVAGRTETPGMLHAQTTEAALRRRDQEREIAPRAAHPACNPGDETSTPPQRPKRSSDLDPPHARTNSFTSTFRPSQIESERAA